MVEEIEVKRKVFVIVEQIGERSYKVERKGHFYFLKKYEDDVKGFQNFIDAEHHLRVSGVACPKCLTYDKKTRVAVSDFIEGTNCLEILKNEELSEEVIEGLFKTFWYARSDKLFLDYKPENFIYRDGKLFYLPYRYDKYVNNNDFIQKDIRLWFFTKEFVKYCHDKGISVDESRLKSDYEVNKNIALMTVKYYR